MPERRMDRRAMALLLLAAALPFACEHARHWRGGEPWDKATRRDAVDPQRAEAMLAARMTPAPPPDGHSAEQKRLNSAGCMSCHGPTDDPDMHRTASLSIGCIDCHGGDALVFSTMSEPGRPGEPGTPIEDEAYRSAMLRAHVAPRNPEAWYGGHDLIDGRPFGSHHGSKQPERLHGSSNPAVSAALLNQESPEFIRFVNPGDLRVAAYACGSCHPNEVANVGHSMMAHGAMLWGAALYNNGSIPNKVPRFGESYSAFGQPQRLQGVIEFVEGEDGAERMTVRMPTEQERAAGVLTHLDPLPAWNISQPGNVLRIFERGTKLPVPGTVNPAEIGNPNVLVEGGRPDKGLSPRGLGTLNRTDPVFLGLQKTRLLDPTLNLMGTNDHPGDFRASGCTACHSVYANDRDPYHSDIYAKFGNDGRSHSVDPTLPKNRSGHPIRHELTSAIPNSQCVVCHMHPGTSYANAYLGYMWWDNESDGQFMYPARSKTPTADQEWRSFMLNPEAASKKGLWGDLYPEEKSHAGAVAGEGFLARTGAPRGSEGGTTLNDQLEHNQFADFHGHGWVFRAVFKKDRLGNLLTQDDAVIAPDDPDKWAKAVHLRDVHLARGMQCVDCHFQQDVHGNGKLYGEPRSAIEITCVDCHGTYTAKATLRTSGPAARAGGRDLSRDLIGGKRRFEWRDGELIQRSRMDPSVEWVVPQTLDTINPASAWAVANPDAARASRYAKTMRRDGATWGDISAEPAAMSDLAHGEGTLECYTCHTSWMTSCFGCHLPMQANRRTPMLHNESLFTRNYTQYNYQVLRDDVFMLGRDGPAKGGRIVPVRSSSAVVVSSQNANREWIYHQQQTVSAEGYSGQAFNPHFPHATGGRGTTKSCTDCHASSANDNNAWMAQLTLQGTNFVNFLGRYVYVATGRNGLEAAAVTEHDEPQAVYGSHLHSLAYPDEHAAFVGKQGRRLKEAHHHGGGMGAEVLDVQLRGEYLYAARGPAGFYAFDVANIDNKGFSERIITAPVSPLGQRLGFKTSFAVAVASPATIAVDPGRGRFSEDPTKPYTSIMEPAEPWHVNREQPIHPLYAYLYVGDRDEGLILTNAATLLDGDPTNNFMERAKLRDGADAFNPDGLLTGLTHLVVAGRHVYATSASGLVVIDVDAPLDPKVVAVVGSDALTRPQSVGVQFRYAFVTDAEGLKTIDITDPARPFVVAGTTVALEDARRLYVSRTRVFVAAGRQGLAIVDVTNPERPSLEELFTAEGMIDDARDVKVGMAYASLFAYVADGANGLRVIELMGPHSTAQFRGFAPPLEPRLIATYPTHGAAVAVSEGLDRDRAVDESGNQVAVFGRLGARPLSLEEMQRLYLKDGTLWTVSDEPTTAPRDFTYEAPGEAAPEGTRRRRRGG